MEIRLVSNFYDIPNEHYLLNLIFTEGLDYYHLRKKNYSEENYKSYLDRIPSYYHDRIIIHDHFHLADHYNLHGIHFTKRYKLEDYLQAQALNSPKKTVGQIGFSLHSIAEVHEYGKTYDYLFLSPIFDSISNKGYNSKFKLTTLKNFLQQAEDGPKIIGLGGMNLERIETAIGLGLDGISLLGYIWSDYEVDGDLLKAIKRFEAIRNIIKR